MSGPAYNIYVHKYMLNAEAGAYGGRWLYAHLIIPYGPRNAPRFAVVIIYKHNIVSMNVVRTQTPPQKHARRPYRNMLPVVFATVIVAAGAGAAR